MFFVRTTTWGMILTCDNLMKKGITLVDRYCMCRRNDETGSSIIAYALWNLSFGRSGFNGLYGEVLLIFYWDEGIGLENTLLYFGI